MIRNKHGNYPGHIFDQAGHSGLNSASPDYQLPVKAAPTPALPFAEVTLKDKGPQRRVLIPAFYSVFLFLSLPEHCKGAPNFPHKRTGLERIPDEPAGDPQKLAILISTADRGCRHKDTNHGKMGEVVRCRMRNSTADPVSVRGMFHN